MPTGTVNIVDERGIESFKLVEQLMAGKQRPNHAQYLAVLRSMTPSQRLMKAFELTAMTRQLFWAGLKRRFPDLPEAELKKLYVKRLFERSNRNS